MSSKIPLLISIGLIATGLIVLRAQFTTDTTTEGLVELKASMNEQPRQRGQSIYFDFEGYHIRTSVYPKISYGDVIKVKGEANEDRFISFPEIKKVDRTSNLHTFLFSIRTKIDEKIDKFLPEPQASLLSGILLGVDKGLPQGFDNALRKTGTIHVVVVSGYNILVVGGFFLLLAGAIKRKYAITLSLVAIVFYTLLTGAQPPTVRAAIMGGLAFSATLFGRQNLPLYSLLLAAFVMLIISPQIISDIGFQLSFMATAGIILFKDSLFNYLKKIPSPFGEDLTTTLSAQLLVIPILFFHFGKISIISPFINALVLWTIPFSTVVGFGIAIFGLLFEPLGQFFAWITWVPLSIFVWVVEASAKVPLSQIEVSENNLALLTTYYAVLALLAILAIKYVRIYKKKSK